MPSTLQTGNVENQETPVMGYNVQVRNSSSHQQLSKGKVPSPSGGSSLKSNEKERTLRSKKPFKQTDSEQQTATTRKIDYGGLVPPMPLGNYQKPWPSSKAAGVEELVRYMSNVPGYLQRMDRGDNFQEKALNFGVLDWGRLEKWTNNKKQADNGRGGDSPSRRSASSSLPTFGSPTQSSRSIGSPVAQRKQSPSLDSCWNPYAEEGLTQIADEKKSGHIAGFPDSKTASINISAGHHQLFETGCRIGTDPLGHKHETGKRKGSGLKAIPCNTSHSPAIGTSPSKSKDYEILASAHDRVKAQGGKSGREAEKFQGLDYGQQNSPNDSARDLLQDQSVVISQHIEGMWDHLEESVYERRISFESTGCDNVWPIEVHRNSFSGNFPSMDAQFNDLSPQVPRSCPLPYTIINEPDATSTLLRSDVIPATKSRGEYEKHKQSTANPGKVFKVKTADRLGQDEVNVTTSTGRELSSGHQSGAGLNWMIRSSSLREGSSALQLKRSACSNNSLGDKANANSKGRRSPLRRILDPLLKPRNQNHELNNTDKPQIREESTPTLGSIMSSQAKRNLNSSTQVPASNCGSLQDERQHGASTEQALLQLAWKNGLPMFMLSSNNSDILAATVRKKSISDKENFECMYTFYSVREMKKKSGWMNQGSKRHCLFSNVVGQMNVSCSELTSYDFKNPSFVREFVLFGAELTTRTHEPVHPTFNSELAAIVISIPDQKPEITNRDVLNSSSCRDSSESKLAEGKFNCYNIENIQTKPNTESRSLPNIVAILPSGVHGLSSMGEPSPLVERWKSGGSCDCGGWDEGCILTILVDKFQEGKSSGSVQARRTTDGTQNIELFIQGSTRENRNAFSLVPFKEGLHTVDFGSSISPLQAFAICVATLHNSLPPDHSQPHYSVEAKSVQEHVFTDHLNKAPAKIQGETPTSYIPYHPPLSPFGRA